MIPIVVCTVGSPSLPVLQASVTAYAPDTPLLVFKGYLGNFGDDYNSAMVEAFKEHDEIIIANDDVVLNPNTMRLLLDDIAMLKRDGVKIGFVATRSDAVRPLQNIRVQPQTEHIVKEVLSISPIFAYISKEAFEVAGFPPINWYSDDVMCFDLSKEGYRHFVSRAYVHHAGSMTVGQDSEKLINADSPWVINHRPELAKHIIGTANA